MKKLIFVLILSLIFISCSRSYFVRSGSKVIYSRNGQNIVVQGLEKKNLITKDELIKNLSDNTWFLKSEEKGYLTLYYNDDFLILARKANIKIYGYCLYRYSKHEWDNSFTPEAVQYLKIISRDWIFSNEDVYE